MIASVQLLAQCVQLLALVQWCPKEERLHQLCIQDMQATHHSGWPRARMHCAGMAKVVWFLQSALQVQHESMCNNLLNIRPSAHERSGHFLARGTVSGDASSQVQHGQGQHGRMPSACATHTHVYAHLYCVCIAGQLVLVDCLQHTPGVGIVWKVIHLHSTVHTGRITDAFT